MAAFSIAALLSASVDEELRAAVGQARKDLDQGRYDAAIQRLQKSIPEAAALADAAEKSQALSAIHFYSALAFFRAGDAARSREQLEQFLIFVNGQASLDSGSYEKDFVALFNEVAASRDIAAADFDRLYPGFRSFATRPREPVSTERWDTSTEMILLSTPEERSSFNVLRDEESRRSFIEQFWRRRDKEPEDDPRNKFRDEFETRAAFADSVFSTKFEERGSLTDRGRAFVLLGKPRFTQVKPLSRRDGTLTAREPNLGYDGTVERWFYPREQLPWSPPSRLVEFRFITRKGVGDHVLQRDPMTTKVLEQAKSRQIEN